MDIHSSPTPDVTFKTAMPRRRVLLEITAYGSDKAHWAAAKIASYGGDRIWLSTPYGDHAFSRDDGRWIEGPCLNLECSVIHQFDDLESAIQGGAVTSLYEMLVIEAPQPQ